MYAHLKGNHNIDKDQNARFDNITDHREKEDKSEQELIEKTIDPENNQAKESSKKNKECKSCKEIITCKNDRQVASHYESCKVYFEHIKSLLMDMTVKHALTKQTVQRSLPEP